MTNLTLDEKKELIRMALKAREGAYVPYSDFMVGAALRAEDGRIFTGCNVENAAFTPTSCAERTALFKAVSEGVTKFTDIAVVGARRGEVNKVVLARDLRVEADEPIDLRYLLARLIDRYPMTWTYLVDGMVGIANGDNPRIIESRLRGYVF